MLTCKVGSKIINTFSNRDSDLREWSNKKILKCPDCDTRIIYKNGRFKIAHFSHIKSCGMKNQMVYSHPETEEHMRGKIAIYEWLKTKPVQNLRLESWIPETRQRPDIYFEYNGEKYVVELQCSPISTEYSKRHELYSMAGIKDIWILGKEKYGISNMFLNEIKTKTISREVLFKHNSNLMYFDVDNKIITIATRENMHPIENKATMFKMKNAEKVRLCELELKQLLDTHTDETFWNQVSKVVKEKFSNGSVDYSEKFVDDIIIFRKRSDKYLFKINSGYQLRNSSKSLKKHNSEGINTVEIFDYEIYKNHINKDGFLSNSIPYGNYIDYKNKKAYILENDGNKYFVGYWGSGYIDKVKVTEVDLSSITIESLVSINGASDVYKYDITIFKIGDHISDQKFKLINHDGDDDKVCKEILKQCRKMASRGILNYNYGVKFPKNSIRNIEYFAEKMNKFGFCNVKFISERKG